MKIDEGLSNSERARQILKEAAMKVKSLEEEIGTIYPDKGYTAVLKPPQFWSSKDKGTLPEERKAALQNEISEIKKNSIQQIEGLMMNEPSQARADMRGQVERTLFSEQFEKTINEPEAIHTQAKGISASQGYAALVRSSDHEPKKLEFLSNEFSITKDAHKGKEDVDLERD